MHARGRAHVIDWLVRHQMGLAFTLAACLLLAIAVIAVGARRLVEQYESLGHATEALTELDQLLSGVTAAQSAQHGFVATGDKELQATYEAAAHDAAERFKALRALAADHPRQQEHLDALEPLVTQELAEQRDTIRRRRALGADAALRLMLAGPQHRVMEQIRSIVAAMKAEERESLAGQAARHAEQVRRIFLALMALALATAAALVVLLAESRRRAGEFRLAREALVTQVAEHEETSSLLTALVQSSDDAIIGLGPDDRILTWNRGAERIYGLGEAEARGRTMDTLVAPARVREISALLGRVRRDATAERLELDHLTRDGRPLHVLLTVFPIRGGQEQVIGVAVVTRDITAQKQAEEARRRSEETSRAFLESAAEGIVAADAAGRIVLVNAKAEEMFGYSRAELVGQPIDLLVPTHLRPSHARHRASYLTAPRVRSMGRGLDLAGRKKDGGTFPVEVSLSYVRADEGTLVLAFIVDISERLAFQRAVRQADKLAALGTLAAGIAHEINNPLGIITSRVEVMLLEAEEDELPEPLREDLDVILRHARRVATITQGLLSFARESSGARGPVNLNRVTEEILQLAQKDMSRAHVTVTTRLDERLPDIVADANAIGQVLLNLLTNARGAMPEGGEITIETRNQPETASVRLQVRDTGAGMPPEVLSRIFDPFFTTKPHGTGLGLSISHGIVHDHRGTIDVRSEVGQGATFTLTFPVDASGNG